jgi:hypothetical protein
LFLGEITPSSEMSIYEGETDAMILMRDM